MFAPETTATMTPTTTVLLLSVLLGILPAALVYFWKSVALNRALASSGKQKQAFHLDHVASPRYRTSSDCSESSTVVSSESSPRSSMDEKCAEQEDTGQVKDTFNCETNCEATDCSSSFDLDIEDTESPGMFCASVFANLRKPLSQASTMPRHCYTSRVWYRQELQRVFLPSWTFMGRTDEVTEAGSYLTLDTAWAGSVLVLRGNDGELRAFANVCRHRGAKLLSQSKGIVKSKIGITCPYHAWLYSLEGDLKSAPGLSKALNFDKKNFGLIPIRLGTFG
jgi:nitrite reductase/ring-hydroxylating ferredoxin subunit